MLFAVTYQQRAEATESKLETLLQSMQGLAGGPSDFPVKAAFVTFNYEGEARACLDNTPTSESMLLRLSYIYLIESWAYWRGNRGS